MHPALLERVYSLLPGEHATPELSRFYELMRDYPGRGGKGLRSELLLASARAHGLRPGGEDANPASSHAGSAYTVSGGWEGAQWLAAALELFQNWVLIHDDIADDSEERRGRPALHRLHGVPVALNVGDALHAYMWAAVARAGVPGATEEFLDMIHRTAEGQHLDLAWVEGREWNLGEADYLQMVELKTAYYTVIAPLRLGALAAGQLPAPGFTPAGLALGAAFQIRDDVLNLAGDPVKYGKEIAGDLWEGKRTLMVLHWLRGAPPAERAEFLEQMNRDRAHKDPAAINRIHERLLRGGSVAYAQAYAQAEGERGLAALEAALSGAPDPAAAAELLALVRELATRDK